MIHIKPQVSTPFPSPFIPSLLSFIICRGLLKGSQGRGQEPQEAWPAAASLTCVGERGKVSGFSSQR